MAFTFKGGIHIPEHKHSSGNDTLTINTPPSVTITMNQNIGAPATPAVKKGDRVLTGQVIGTVPDTALGCPVHASITGTVREITETLLPSGAIEKAIVIDSDGTDELSPEIVPVDKSIRDLSREEIISVVRKAGIVGMGGAAFPTYAKISSAIGKAQYLIVNGAECEPFITSDHRLMLEHPDEIIKGVKILLKAVGAPHAYIAVEDNKKNAINKLRDEIDDDSLITVKVMKTKYPQGDERQLIYALTGAELPAGKLPADVGCVIFNAATCAAVYRAFSTGMPLIRRIVTVSGDCIKSPKNIIAPLGTPSDYLAELCGGLKKTPKKLVFGGPMMGQTQWNPAAPLKKNTSSVLFLSEDFNKKSKAPPVCINCGKCVANCPMHLMPSFIAKAVIIEDMAAAEKYGAMSCVECGSCSYGCPGKVEIVQLVRVAKNKIRTEAARMKKAREESEKK